jgi:hypothetical protein
MAKLSDDDQEPFGSTEAKPSLALSNRKHGLPLDAAS